MFDESDDVSVCTARQCSRRPCRSPPGCREPRCAPRASPARGRIGAPPAAMAAATVVQAVPGKLRIDARDLARLLGGVARATSEGGVSSSSTSSRTRPPMTALCGHAGGRKHMCPFLQLRSNRVTVSVHPHARSRTPSLLKPRRDDARRDLTNPTVAQARRPVVKLDVVVVLVVRLLLRRPAVVDLEQQSASAAAVVVIVVGAQLDGRRRVGAQRAQRFTACSFESGACPKRARAARRAFSAGVRAACSAAIRWP